MGSNPSTESNYKTAVNSKNKMQMLCMRPGTTAEGYNQGREPKNSMHSSTESSIDMCGHATRCIGADKSQQEDASAESPLALTSWKLNNKALRYDLIANSKGYLNSEHTAKVNNFAILLTANNSLREWYRMKELLKWSPTLPRTSKKVAGNDGNSSEKLTANSTRGFLQLDTKNYQQLNNPTADQAPREIMRQLMPVGSG
ncbi:MLO-like protein [Dorcoceras hygrometricum]|uniref:MLO-like protein n=1 Tax=Dorcoceras hygrometricum TaxID=472368 RepID=A0A2Z7AHT3_9LAMI|nr:MLO-like protein [Dorcoceras hygrometricum]